MYNKNKGILYIILSALSFATMSLFLQLSGDIPVIQKSMFRNLVAMIFAFIIIMRTGRDFSFKKGNLKFLILRSSFGTVGIFLNFYAIENLYLADASIIGKLSPFFVIIFSFFILKEKIKLWQGICIFIAFFGSIFIIDPNIILSPILGTSVASNMISIPAVSGLLGAMCAGVAYTIIRLLSIRGERGPFIVFFFSAFSTVACIPFIIFNFVPMNLTDTLLLLGAGFFASLGQFAITAAYSNAPAKMISIYDYTQIIFSTAYGFIIFGQVPNPYSLIGYILIISVAIYMYINSNKN